MKQQKPQACASICNDINIFIWFSICMITKSLLGFSQHSPSCSMIITTKRLHSRYLNSNLLCLTLPLPVLPQAHMNLLTLNTVLLSSPQTPTTLYSKYFPNVFFSFCICSERSLNKCLTPSPPRWLYEYVVTPFCFQKGSFTLFSTECSRQPQKLISDGFAFSGSTWSLSFISTFPIPVPSSSIPRTLLPLCL